MGNNNNGGVSSLDVSEMLDCSSLGVSAEQIGRDVEELFEKFHLDLSSLPTREEAIKEAGTIAKREKPHVSFNMEQSVAPLKKVVVKQEQTKPGMAQVYPKVAKFVESVQEGMTDSLSNNQVEFYYKLGAAVYLEFERKADGLGIGCFRPEDDLGEDKHDQGNLQKNLNLVGCMQAVELNSMRNQQQLEGILISGSASFYMVKGMLQGTKKTM